MAQYKMGAFLNICTDNPSTWREDLKAIEKLRGVDHLELWVETILTRDSAAILRSMLSGYKLIMHGPFIHLSLVSHVSSVNEWSLRRFNEAVELATQLEAGIVTFHAGTYPVFGESERALQALAERFCAFRKVREPGRNLREYATTRWDRA